MSDLPGLREVEHARDLLGGIPHRTPILTSRKLDERCGGHVLVKAEHLQRTGSFKIRGAYAHIAQLSDERRAHGVIAASAGNHAQGVAWAATRAGIGSTVVMPVFASLTKIEATRGYGADVELAGDTFEGSLAHAAALADERGASLIHAFDDPWVIAGQGTVALELCEDAPGIDRVIVPVGGGGLISGVATAVKALAPEVEVIGVRPAGTPDTIADGAAVKAPGALTGRIIEASVDRMVEVDEDAISEAIVLHLEWMKQVVEGAGALPLAALLSGAVPSGGTSALIASGGNIDPGLLMRVIRHGLTGSGRYLFIHLLLADRPGQLQGVLAELARMHVNVLSVTHHRAGLSLPVGGVDVELTLETRDRAHARDVADALQEAGYDVRRLTL